jgi:predicted transcriptional regulator
MTDLKFSILKKLYRAKDNRCDQNKLISKHRKKLTKARCAVEDLIKLGMIKKLNDIYIELTRAGEELYEEERDLRKRERHSFIIALISVIAASIAALVPFIEFMLSR